MPAESSLTVLLGFLRSALTRRRHEDEALGTLTYRWGGWTGSMNFSGSAVRITLPGPANEGPRPDARALLLRLAGRSGPVLSDMEPCMLHEYAEVRGSFAAEDAELVARLDAIREEKTGAFARTFRPVSVEVVEDPEHGRIEGAHVELLSPWDPEHTYVAVLDARLHIRQFVLRVAM